MPAKARIIIDTDPGVDDILAILLAFASKSEELEVLLLSLTFGNVDVQNCLRNVVSLFHIINKEQEWRRKNNEANGFDVLKTCRPIVAVGAEEPLAGQLMLADFFHGRDGLGGIHESHPHLTPSDAWRTLFPAPSTIATTEPSFSAPPSTTEFDLSQTSAEHKFFVPSKLPAHMEMLRILKEEPKESITIVAVGPLTNLALAAAEDVETFLRVKEVVVMGGAVDVPGNITPLAEFNTHSDAYAFARMLALTSPTPYSTIPPTPPNDPSNPTPNPPPPHLSPYPPHLSRRLLLTLLPLDITTRHLLYHSTTFRIVEPLREAGSPLAEWVCAFLGPTWRRSKESGLDGLSLHDPLAIWYAISRANFTSPEDDWQIKPELDIRVEAAGQWTRGACIVDRRGRKKTKGYGKVLEEDKSGPAVSEEEIKPRPGDAGGWLDERLGNRVDLVVESPGDTVRTFENELLGRIFGVEVGKE